MSGVKGMRWGVRKRRTRNVRKYPVGPVKVNPHTGASGSLGPTGPGTGHRNYDINKLDNASLQKVINRMALEKKYNELNQRKPVDETDPIKKFINNATKNSLNAALNATTTHMVNLFLKKKFPHPKGSDK